MKAANSLVQRKEKQSFSTAIRGESLQSLIRKSVATTADAARLTGTLISAVAANQNLQNCVPASIVAAALRGEGMKLTYGTDYHLVPFGDRCQYLISYKGLLHLLIATGEVADANVVTVVEGEYKGRNKKTKRPEFDFSVYADDEEESGHPVVGWYFYVEMRNGYTASEFMRVSEILAHAERYSRSFDRATYEKLQRGEYSPQEAEKIKEKSPWYSNFEIMAAKTVIRRLLNSGFVPLANSADLRNALDSDGENGEGEIISASILDSPNGSAVVVESTGEVIEAPQEAADATESAFAEPQDMELVEQEEAPKPHRRAVRKVAKVESAVEPEEYDPVASFFDEE